VEKQQKKMFCKRRSNLFFVGCFPYCFTSRVQLYKMEPSSTSNEFMEAVKLITDNFKGQCEPDQHQLIQLIRNKFFTLFVLKKHDLPSGKTVAGVVVTSNFGVKEVIHLEYIIISEACQGKGVGTIILRNLISLLELEGKLVERSPQFLTLECEEKLIPFYSKVSFKDSNLHPLQSDIERNGKKLCVKYHWMHINITEEDTYIDTKRMATIRKQLIGRLLSIRKKLSQKKQ